LRRRIGRAYASIAIVALAVAFLAVSLIAPALSTTTDFSIYNSGWNGTSQLAIATYNLGLFAPTLRLQETDTEMTVAHLGFEELELDPLSDSLIVIGPSQGFSDGDAEVVDRFVRGGGVLLLADDFGTGNELLEKIGATSRFSNRLLMDLAFDRRAEFSVCFTFVPGPLTRNVTTLLLNYPTSISVGSASVDVSAYSSVASWLDMDEDREMDVGEPRGPFPLLAQEPLENGTIILLSDPSVLINGMQDELDNAMFASNLLTEVSAFRAAVYFDESHRDYFDPIAITVSFVGEMSFNAKFTILVISFVLLLWITTDVVDRSFAWTLKKIMFAYERTFGLLFRSRRKEAKAKPLTEEDILAEAVKKHPGWKPRIMKYALHEQERHKDAASKGPR